MKISILTILICYLAIINVVGLLLMGLDKWKAIHQSWRIPESELFLFAVIGGSIGSILGMYLFRHKTQHLSFVIGMPAIFVVQAAILIWLKFFSPFTFLII